MIRVEDAGPGVTFTEGSGFGLQGMRERATALGGSLDAGPQTRRRLPGHRPTYR